MGNARLLHFENGAWVDITTSVDPGTRTICGQTGNFSPFAIVKAIGPAPAHPDSHPGGSGYHGPKSGNSSAAGPGTVQLIGLPNTGSGAFLAGNGQNTILPGLLGMMALSAALALYAPRRLRGDHQA